MRTTVLVCAVVTLSVVVLRLLGVSTEVPELDRWVVDRMDSVGLH